MKQKLPHEKELAGIIAELAAALERLEKNFEAPPEILREFEHLIDETYDANERCIEIMEIKKLDNQ
jgi:hypothetical protein